MPKSKGHVVETVLAGNLCSHAGHSLCRGCSFIKNLDLEYTKAKIKLSKERTRTQTAPSRQGEHAREQES